MRQAAEATATAECIQVTWYLHNNTANKQQALRLPAHCGRFDIYLDHHNSSFSVTDSSALGYTMHGLIQALSAAFGHSTNIVNHCL